MNLYMFMLMMMMVLVVINVLIAVAFLTLMERKFLSYIQLRKGPNKMGFKGLIQPFSDAVKLMGKESIYVNKSNYMYYMFSPAMSFVLIFMMWMIYPFWCNFLEFKLGLIYLMCCFSLGVYGLLMSGWSSNSSYSMLGSVRSVAQSVSYEVSLAVILITPMLLIGSFNFNKLLFYQGEVWFMVYLWPLGLMFLFSLMAELNRTPFDFSEGESELVSGFNVEYSSSGFILIFLSEYASILFLSMLLVLLYMGGDYWGLLFYVKVMFLSFFIIWLRGTMPRFRYDLLMYFSWLVILPISLNYMFCMIFFKMMICK